MLTEGAAGPRDLSRATDDELIEAARRFDGPRADRCLDELYRRYYPRVAHWCLQVCRNRQEAADVAQEVFLRVHSRLDTFRGQSLFSTWLYTVVRSVAINRGVAERRHRNRTLDVEAAPEPVDPTPDAQTTVEKNDDLQRIRDVMENRLEPLEAQVLYLHYVDGLTLPAITRLLTLDNKSGAKAFLVGAKRKLRRELKVEKQESRIRGEGET